MGNINKPKVKTIGRPSLDPAQKLAARAWFLSVSLSSGGKTAGELESMFNQNPSYNADGLEVSSGIWGKYRDGKICPKQGRDYKGKPSIVERVEERFTDTKLWLNLPLWRVLGSQSLDMNELKSIYLQLSSKIADLLVNPSHGERGIFWRRPGGMEDVYCRLAQIGTVDSATAVLALIKECELTQNQEMHQRGLYHWGICAEHLRSHSVLALLVDGMNQIMADRYERIIYVSADGSYFKLTMSTIRSALQAKCNLLMEDA